MAKSTHRGECQLCGRVQLLPNDRLSIHGYTVKWNMFLGDCKGSREKPYELSCDELKIAVVNTQESIERIEKAINDLTVRTGNTCYFRVYRDHHYHWVEVEILTDEHGRIGYTYDGKSSFNTDEHGRIGYTYDGKSSFNMVMPYFLTTEEAIARHYDYEYIKQVLQPNLAALKAYRTWCEDRIENWVLKPLPLR